MNGASLVKAFVGLPGGGTAVYTSAGLAYYRHADWLGSSRLASTQSRTLYSSTAYAPFGEQYASSGTADASFTGQNSDTVSSLYDFTFRRLSPSQGRWISPDPAGLAAVDPVHFGIRIGLILGGMVMGTLCRVRMKSTLAEIYRDKPKLGSNLGPIAAENHAFRSN